MKSIRSRMLVMLLLAPLAVLLVGGAGVYLLTQHTLVSQLDRSLRAQAGAMASLVSREHGRTELEYNDEIIKSGRSILFTLTDSAGRVIINSSAAARIIPVREMRKPGQIYKADFRPRGEDDRWRCLSLSFLPRMEYEDDHEQEEVSGSNDLLIMTVAASRENIDDALSAVAAALALMSLAVALVIIILVWFSVRRGLSPLDQLSREMRKISEKTLATRFPVDSLPLELQPVTRELNDLLQRLEEAMQRERRFTDSAAHELRTPLAELRTGCEVALRWPDAENIQQTLQQARDIGREMEELVSALLILSRSSQDININPDNETADLNEIISSVMTRLGKQADDKQLVININVNPENNITWNVPRAVAEMIIRNLAENAVQYTPPGGKINISAEPTPGSAAACFTVENDTVNMREDYLELMFEPFWQADRSRTDREHHGLGLATVRHLADACRLDLRVSLENKVLRISVTG